MKSSWLKRESHSHGSSELLWHLSPCLNETSLRVVTLRAGARRRQWCMYQTWVIIRLYISHGGGNRHLVVDRYKHSCQGVNCNYCCWVLLHKISLSLRDIIAHGKCTSPWVKWTATSSCPMRPISLIRRPYIYQQQWHRASGTWVMQLQKQGLSSVSVQRKNNLCQVFILPWQASTMEPFFLLRSCL